MAAISTVALHTERFAGEMEAIYILASETDPLDRLNPLPPPNRWNGLHPVYLPCLGILFLSAAVGADQYTHLGRHICDRPHRRHFCKTISDVDFLREEKERERSQ